WKINSFMIDDNRPNLVPYDTIKERVFQQGPITTYMGVYNSFHGYTGGIYEPTTEEELTGKHVVVIIGYGVDSNNRTYWICKNSWGTWWGEGDPNDPICNANPLDPRCKKGYFRIYAGAASAIGYYAESIISPNPPKPQQTICEDKDNDGYCYWGFADQPPATGTLCPKQCKMDNTWKYIKDCDDSNNSFGPFVSGNSLNCQLLHYPADTNNDYKISQAELDDYSSRWKSGMVDIYGYAITTSQVTRAGVFFKAGGYKLQAGTIDGFAPITSS
ncbi:MAG: hypothetical protein NT094_00060, partial [Candidatus Staskawiczbacteria bacterium]|nr:hypothetical protein [Candidatus Staskawiczbacteria bacterium]